jgi:hypothetical protein
MAAGRFDPVELFRLDRIRGRPPDQVHRAEDGIHRRPDFVAHVGQEGALGPRRRLGLLLGQPQFLLDALQFADVADEGNETRRKLRPRLPLVQRDIDRNQAAVAMPVPGVEAGPPQAAEFLGRFPKAGASQPGSMSWSDSSSSWSAAYPSISAAAS